jgi:hypothetical protein
MEKYPASITKPGDGWCVHLYYRNHWFGRTEGGHSSWIKDRKAADDFAREFNSPNADISDGVNKSKP